VYHFCVSLGEYEDHKYALPILVNEVILKWFKDALTSEEDVCFSVLFNEKLCGVRMVSIRS
jgi:hypothetical protein